MLATSVLLGLMGSAALAQEAPRPAAGQPDAEVAASVPLTSSACDKDLGEIVVCGRKEGSIYRIDPSVLAASRARDALPVDNRSAQQRAVQLSCHDEVSKCQGSGVVPLLPVAIKLVQAGLLAGKGEDWRQPFRTKADEYELYRASKAKRSRISVGFGAEARKR